MSETGYKVIKLKSGETLVAQVKENTKSHVGVFRPMEIKYMHMVDLGGRKHETMVLVDWLKSTVENSFKIDKEFILGVFNPRPDIISQYENQMVLEDVGGGHMNQILPIPIAPPQQKQGQPPQSIQDLIADALIKDLLSSAPKMTDDDIDALEGGDLVQDLIAKSKNEKMINEKDDPNYGSSYCDWSSNVEDYLS